MLEKILEILELEIERSSLPIEKRAEILGRMNSILFPVKKEKVVESSEKVVGLVESSEKVIEVVESKIEQPIPSLRKSGGPIDDNTIEEDIEYFLLDHGPSTCLQIAEVLGIKGNVCREYLVGLVDNETIKYKNNLYYLEFAENGEKLKTKEEKILEFLKEHGSASGKKIAESLGMKSLSERYAILNKMVEKDLIRHNGLKGSKSLYSSKELPVSL